mgnify:FL=1
MIATLMQNDLFLGGLCTALIVVPVVGMQIVHTPRKHEPNPKTSD